MRYALVSDIHGNRQALNAVLTDVQCRDVDEIICLGDIVGYGPAPAEVLTTIYSCASHIVLGNHDAVLAGKLDGSYFNDSARLMLDWTQGELDDRAREFLGNVPYVLEGDNFRCVHSQPAFPKEFAYIYDREEAATAWNSCEEQLIFVGHTHFPALFVVGSSGNVHNLPIQDFTLEEGKRYIVNVGSVGQPRDGDPRASYCIFDTESDNIYHHRVGFDIEAYKEEVEKRQVPCPQTYFLEVARESSLPPVRDMVDFKPTGKEENDDDVTVKKLQQVNRRFKFWRTVGIAAFLASLFLLVGGAHMVMQENNNALHTIEPLQPQTPKTAPDVDTELLPEPIKLDKVSRKTPFKNWKTALEKPSQQQVSSAPGKDGSNDINVLRLKNDGMHRFRLVPSPVKAKHGTRYTAKAQFKNISVEKGFVEVQVFQRTDNGERLLMKNASDNLLERPDHWLPTSETLEKPLSRDTMLQYVISGECSGTLAIRKCSFFRRE